MKNKLLQGFCPHCRNTYYGKKLISVFGISIPEGHNCKEAQEFLKAQQKRYGKFNNLKVGIINQ